MGRQPCSKARDRGLEHLGSISRDWMLARLPVGDGDILRTTGKENRDQLRVRGKLYSSPNQHLDYC
jgi:hypothetical protein